LASKELGAEAMTTSAYNLGKSGLASKILRTKDLMLSAEEGFPILGKDMGGVVKGRMRPSAGEVGESLGVRSGILPIWTVEISQ
jgi:hypothetical protein